jgi:hypothetical protein
MANLHVLNFTFVLNIVLQPTAGQLWLKHVATVWINVAMLDGLF